VIYYELGVTHPFSRELSVNSTYQFSQTRFNSIATTRVDYDQGLSAGITYARNKRLVFGADVGFSLRRYGSEEGVEHYDVKNKTLTLTANYKIR
jgi:hypothetical protein